jgi:hypothetical protein
MLKDINIPYSAGIIVTLTLALWVSPGCEESLEIPEDSIFISDNDVEARNCRDPATAWPEGWMVAHHEEWLPVLDDLGRRLHDARETFQNGDRAIAAAEIRSGLVFLEGQLADSSERDRAALENAISTLRVIADRLSDGESVTLEQLDIAFVNAYLSNLEREALVVDTDATEPYLGRPDRHLERALQAFLDGAAEDASREVDMASAYLYLEGNRLEFGERAELNKAAQDLEHLSARLRLQQIDDREDLNDAFEPARQRWQRHARAPARPRSLGLMSR